MIEDRELDTLLEERNVPLTDVKDNSISIAKAMETDFARKMDDVKQNVLQAAEQNDNDFKKKIVENVKKAAVTLTEVEKDKAEYVRQQVGYESTKLDTKSQQELFQQDDDKWNNRRAKRQYHYDGVKALMEFMNIKDPMNLLFLYFFAFIAIIPFIIHKIWLMTIGALLSGAQDENRPKAAKGFIWTILAVFTLIALFVLVYLFLQWQGIDILSSLKS